MSKPLVSIIVPVYNTQAYLSKCLDSLLSQTYPHIEILVVNDGSTDDSQSIIEKYSQKNHRIYGINQKNGGLSSARNTGIQNAKGAYYSFVDSDDWIEEDMISTMMEEVLKYDADMGICNIHKVNEKNEVFNEIPQLTHLSSPIDLHQDFSAFGEMSCFACNKLYKKELFNTITFPEGMHFEDIATIPRLFLACKKIIIVPNFFYNYFERQSSITQHFSEKGLDIFKAISMVKNDFDTSDYSSEKGEFQRFVIMQGYYSFLAYWVRVKDGKTRKNMCRIAIENWKNEKLRLQDILLYSRNNKNYFLSISIFKKVFYLYTFIRFIFAK